MSFAFALFLCLACQVLSFYPFYAVWKQDRKKYGDDLGVPLSKRFLAWLVVFPVWALPFATMAGGGT